MMLPPSKNNGHKELLILVAPVFGHFQRTVQLGLRILNALAFY
jgi:hypothetical protein